MLCCLTTRGQQCSFSSRLNRKWVLMNALGAGVLSFRSSKFVHGLGGIFSPLGFVRQRIPIS